MRTTVLLAAVLLIAGLAALTIRDVVRNGFTPLAFVSVMLLALLTIGILGALRHPPGE